LGGLALSFYFGIAFGIAAAIYMLRRTVRSNRAQATILGQ
jgi:hypothetical protein